MAGSANWIAIPNVLDRPFSDKEERSGSEQPEYPELLRSPFTPPVQASSGSDHEIERPLLERDVLE